MIDVYERNIMNDLESLCAGCYYDMANLHKYDKDLANGILCNLLIWACKPQNATPIMIARRKIGEIDKDWLRVHFLEAAKAAVDFTDYWEYRRLLELIVCEIPELKPWALKMCEDSEDEDILEVLEDYGE